jgi:peptidoglycan L-alanyl-D-glutamate endopeptidase CwlK
MNTDWLYKNRYYVGGGLSLAIIGVVLYTNRTKVKKLSSDIMEYTQNKVWDLVSEGKIETLHPKIRDKARELVNRVEKELGIKIRVTSGFRTYAEQDKLYAQGRTTKGGIVTNAKGGQSNHNFGTAIDVVPIVNGKADWKTTSDTWGKIAKIGKEVGFAWGGDWKGLVDKPHFEMQFGNTLAQLRKKYESGEKDGEYVKLT